MYGAQRWHELFITGVFKDRLDGNPTMECDSLGPAVFLMTFLIPTLNCSGTGELEEISPAVIVEASFLFDLLNKVQIPPCLTLVFLATHLFVKKTLRRHRIKTRLSEGLEEHQLGEPVVGQLGMENDWFYVQSSCEMFCGILGTCHC